MDWLQLWILGALLGSKQTVSTEMNDAESCSQIALCSSSNTVGNSNFVQNRGFFKMASLLCTGKISKNHRS